MLALLGWTTGNGPGPTMLQALRHQFLWYLTGDMMVGVVVAVAFYRLLWPVVLARLPRPPQRWYGWWCAAGGAAAALVPLGLTVLLGLASGAYAPQTPGYLPYAPFLTGAAAPAAWKVWVFFAVQSSFEELLFRGVGLALLATLLCWLTRVVALEGASHAPPRDFTPGRSWFFCGLLANLVVSMAFGLIHEDNPHATVFAVCNIALAGFALGQLYWLQRNLWGACVMHTAWNAVLATFGLPVSGIVARGPLLGNIRGSVDNLITGGEFGPEASAVTTLGLLLVGLYLVWLTWRVAQEPHTTTPPADPGPPGAATAETIGSDG